MGEVFQFPPRGHLEIRGGRIETATITDASGTRVLLDQIGQPRYFVDAVDPEGIRRCMWAGSSHDEAHRVAADLRATGFGDVRDFVGSTAVSFGHQG